MDRIQKRFDELERTAEEIVSGFKMEATQVRSNVQPIGAGHVNYLPGTKYVADHEAIDQWVVSVKSLLHQVFGPDMPTYVDFYEATRSSYGNGHYRFRVLNSVFRSAKEQFEGGYLFDVQNLVHAEVFSNELEQAEHFLNNKYDVAAAVTVGVVLETTIKKLCTLQSPPIDLHGSNDKGKKTDTLITDLKTAGVYNEAVAKQLRAWMNVRNDAAHGTRGNGEFDEGEIRRMIDGVQDFVAKHMN